MSIVSYSSVAWSLVGVVTVGLAAQSAGEWFDRSPLGLLYSTVGWAGLVGGAVALQFGDQWEVGLMPVPVALEMAAAGALVVAPLSGDRDEIAPLAAGASAVVALAAGGGAIWMARSVGSSPWPNAALLLGANWSLLAASAASALTGAFVAGRSIYRAFGDESPESPALRGHARDAATRAVVLLWLGWSAASLVHRQFIGTTGLGSRSEWLAFGATLLATGCLLIGWDLGDDTSARIRSTAAPIAVAAVIVAAIWISFGFGSPFGLSLGS